MKIARLVGLSVVVAAMFFVAIAQDETDNPCAVGDATYYVRTNKLTNPRERLDPTAPIIRTVRRGEYLECISAGALWYRVRVDGREGFIEVRDGDIVDRKGNPHLVMGIIIAVLLIGCVGCVILFVKKGHANTNAVV